MHAVIECEAALIALTRQLLAFSRKQILQPTVLDLNSVVANLERMLRRLIGEDIDLSASLAPDLGQVKVDPGQIDQVIINLIVNARDAMPAGGKLTIETANATLDDGYCHDHVPCVPGSYIMLAVSDTGTGMDAETQERIFEPFFTTKAAGKGTGLGLSTAYGIVKQSGGNIWVYSELGKGTTFKIYLPRADEAVETETPTGLAKPAPHGTETILLVEDEEQVRQIAQQILTILGYTVLPATNGQEALAVARQHSGTIDLTITDVVMPQLSGRELIERLVPRRPEMKVIFMSGYTDDAIVRHGPLDERLESIQKPFAADAFARKIRSVLDQREPKVESLESESPESGAQSR
jgi:CheY-like chemotaxis protein